MDLDFFKKQLGDIKQAKLETEEKERQEYKVLFEQAVNGLKELIEKLKPYIECAKKEFDLSDHIKEITNNVQYSYSSSIRWNKNFDEAIKKPFYADEINAFQLVVTEGDGFATVYTCKSAIVFAVIAGVVEVVLIGFTAVSLFLLKKKIALA
jgi:hypothetical protein